MQLGVVLALMAVTSDDPSTLPPSKWARRTERKRQRVGALLERIPPPPLVASCQSLSDLVVETLESASSIDWDLYPNLDPQGGGLLKKDSARATRKRRQIEAFVYLCQTIGLPNNDDDSTIVDAGSGAGNLAIPLAGLLDVNVLAIDVNDIALDRLQTRADTKRVTTMCADLATLASIPNASLICSLHACGAATDLAMRLATRNRLPFVVSPCCTAKALTARTTSNVPKYGPSATMERSGSPSDIKYPRSQWLQSHLSGVPSEDTDDESTVESEQQNYALIAKVADVGLGPQTPLEQRQHQQVAKYIVELDRLMGVVERHDYVVRMFRMKDHGDDYGKSEIMVGVPKYMEHVLDDIL
jgi:hypothetical protein